MKPSPFFTQLYFLAAKSLIFATSKLQPSLFSQFAVLLVANQS